MANTNDDLLEDRLTNFLYGEHPFHHTPEEWNALVQAFRRLRKELKSLKQTRVDIYEAH